MRCKTSFSTQFFDTNNFEDLGKKAAEWLRDQFIQNGYSKMELVPVDWGWIIIVKNKPFISWVGCSHEMAHTNRWSIIIGAEPGMMQKMFKKHSLTNHFEQLKDQINEILLTIPDIQDIEWQDQEALSSE